MTAFSFQRCVIDVVDAPWRAFDWVIARWVLSHGGDQALAVVAAWASYVESFGDVALPLGGCEGRDGWSGLDTEAIAALRRSPLVSDGFANALRPFVIDADDRFYLLRNFEQERAVATAVLERLQVSAAPADRGADVDLLFGVAVNTQDQSQRDAVSKVPEEGLFVLTGGPGTGKTRTIMNMLLMLQRKARVRRSIALTAPTGKAAQRLRLSLQQSSSTLTSSLPDDWEGPLSTVALAGVQTLHRLLEFDPRRNGFRRDPEHPIDADIVVVDEASMMDLGLLAALLAALPRKSCLILVGDADQLTSVAAGSVFQDLVLALQTTHPERVVRLHHSFRSSAALSVINAAVVSGDRERVHAAMLEAGDMAMRYSIRSAADLRLQSDRWAGIIATEWVRSIEDEDSAAHTQSVRRALQTLSRRQILCALRDDAFGAVSVNRLIESALKRHWGIAEDQLWFAGRSIMVLRNDYALGLFNGDIGLTLRSPSGELKVWFESTDQDGQPILRAFAPSSLPEHEGAFAITIHKSQGSEYDEVAVVLPRYDEHRIMSRQLLYTAVSRARARIEIWGKESVLDSGLAQIALRFGGLKSRLMRAGLADSRE